MHRNFKLYKVTMYILYTYSRTTCKCIPDSFLQKKNKVLQALSNLLFSFGNNLASFFLSQLLKQLDNTCSNNSNNNKNNSLLLSVADCIITNSYNAFLMTMIIMCIMGILSHSLELLEETIEKHTISFISLYKTHYIVI